VHQPVISVKSFHLENVIAIFLWFAELVFLNGIIEVFPKYVDALSNAELKVILSPDKGHEVLAAGQSIRWLWTHQNLLK
jgi:hypothetical protein